VGAVLLVSAGAAAKPGVAVSTVNLRAEANTTSAVLAKIPAGGRIEVGDCNDGWCAVTFQGNSGFAIQTALDASGRPRRAAVRRGPPQGIDPDDDFEPVAPGYGAYGPPVVYGPGPYYAPGPYYGPPIGIYGVYGGWGRGYGRGWGRRW
jgi:hypothetical protein